MHRNVHKTKINSLFDNLKTNTKLPILVIVFAVIGSVLVVSSHAATTSLPLEAESGVIAGNAVKVADPAASGGNKVTFTAAAGGTGGTGGTTMNQPTGVTGTWISTFDDEFNGTALDTTKWTAEKSAGYNSDETACLDPSTLSVSGGFLNMALNATSCQGKPNMGGAINTTSFQQTYGFFEARMNLPGDGSSTYNFPAFWIVPYTNGAPCWPTGGELDIMETIGGGAKTSYGYGTSCDNVTNGWSQFDGGSGYWGGWHTFAADWEPGSMTVYYDGKKVGTHNDSGVKSLMNVIIDNTSRPMGGATKTGTKVQVDYVRVWKKG